MREKESDLYHILDYVDRLSDTTTHPKDPFTGGHYSFMKKKLGNNDYFLQRFCSFVCIDVTMVGHIHACQQSLIGIDLLGYISKETSHWASRYYY